MKLAFNLKGMFLFSLFLMFWQMLMPGAFVCGSSLILGYMGYCYYLKKVNICDILFSSSVIVNLWYVSNLSINIHQYDYFNFFMHAMYFVDHDFFIKNPIYYLTSIYFQPPLWGLIAGIITKIGIIFSLTREYAFDHVRYISFFAISGVGILGWRFFNLFNLNKKILLWGYGVFLFMPIHTIMAGLNNNDSFVYFLMVAILYKGYQWYIKHNKRDALIISGLFLLAGMTKFSGLMMMSYVGILGLALLIESKNKLSYKLWSEFFIIGMGGIIGFLWGCLLLYLGLALVPPPNNVTFQFMGDYSIFERLLDFSNINVLFADVRNGVIEPNVWLSLIKTSIFGEWSWKNIYFSYLLYISAILISLVCIWCFGGLFKYQLGKDFGLNLAIIVLVCVVFMSWAMFWIEYPYFCSTEFRYIVVLVPVTCLWVMNYLSQKKLPMWCNYTLAILSCVFVVAKIIVYLNTI